MTLATPIWLAAAASIAVPILIHLFGRPRPKLRRFSSLMLLREAQTQRRSTTRLRRIISLILRCLALVLLAGVLAGPLSAWPPLARLGEPPGATAIILDQSPSMSATSGDARPIDRARTAGLTLINRAPSGTGFTLMTGAGGPQALRPREAAQALGEVTVDDRRARLGEQVATLLDAERSVSRIFLLTDLQATSLDPLPSTPPSRAKVFAIDVGDELPANAAITSITSSDDVHLRGRPMDLLVEARTWGEARGRVPVTVSCGAEELTAGIDLLADTSAASTIEVSVEAAGSLSCVAALPGDALPADSERTFATHVRDRLRVAVAGAGERTRFIEAALDPYADGDARSAVEVLPEDAISTDADIDAVIVASGDLIASALAGLRGLMESGTGVLVFANTDRAVLNTAGFESVAIGGAAQREDGAALAEMATDRPPLAAFAEPGSGDLSAARFTRIPDVEVAEAADLMMLGRYDDGTPALVEGAVDQARTLLLASSPDDAWGDLVRMPEFVPLMHRVVRHLAAGTETTILAGAPGEATVGKAPTDGDDLRVVAGEGYERSVHLSGEWWRFTAPAADTYRLQAAGEDIAAFAVNLDTAESDPARLSASEVRDRLRPLEAEVVAADALGSFLERLGPGAADISSLVALIALLVLAVEGVQSLQSHERSDEK